MHGVRHGSSLFGWKFQLDQNVTACYMCAVTGDVTWTLTVCIRLSSTCCYLLLNTWIPDDLILLSK